MQWSQDIIAQPLPGRLAGPASLPGARRWPRGTSPCAQPRVPIFPGRKESSFALSDVAALSGLAFAFAFAFRSLQMWACWASVINKDIGMYACKTSAAGPPPQAMAEKAPIQMALLRNLTASLMYVYALHYAAKNCLPSAVDHPRSSCQSRL